MRQSANINQLTGELIIDFMNKSFLFMLRSTIRRIEDFNRRYRKSVKNPSEEVLRKSKKMVQELEHFLANSFLADVGEFGSGQSMSLVFGMAPGYRELFHCYLMLQNGISFGGDLFRMSTRDTAQLYEYWCFIKLYDILKKKYTLDSPDLIKVDRRGVTVDLAKGKPSRITFVNTETGERILLTYNPQESKTQTVNQKPDNVLELEKKGAESSYKYVFDAKYRLEMNPDSVFYPDRRPGPKVEDINTMHRYRDSIVAMNPASRFMYEKTMFGAYILFPYNDWEEYRDAPSVENGKEVHGHRFYRSIETVNIGGLPFLPSATNLVTDLLDKLITDSPESAFERASLPVGIEERIKTVDWKRRDVLIGHVPNRENLEMFLQEKMYCTTKFSRDNLPIRYVALYEKGTGIRYYGEVVSWEMTSGFSTKQGSNPPLGRKTEPGADVAPGVKKEQGAEPALGLNKEYGTESGSGSTGIHSEMMYHVFRVLKWEILDEVIIPEEIGPNPIAYTNYFLLSTSRSYSELRIRNEADYRFFMELKRRAKTQIVDDDGDEDSVAFLVEGNKVLQKDGVFYVYKDGRRVGEQTVEEFKRRPNATFRVLREYMRKVEEE